VAGAERSSEAVEPTTPTLTVTLTRYVEYHSVLAVVVVVVVVVLLVVVVVVAAERVGWNNEVWGRRTACTHL